MNLLRVLAQLSKYGGHAAWESLMSEHRTSIKPTVSKATVV